MRILTSIILFVFVVVLGLILSANVIEIIDYFSDYRPHMVFGGTGMLLFPQFCIAIITCKILEESPEEHRNLLFQLSRLISYASLLPLFFFLISIFFYFALSAR